jgi:thiol-disulfide isomerase/thioredoxin
MNRGSVVILWHWLLGTVAAAAILPWVAGCSDSATPAPHASAKLSADQVLADMTMAYQSAKTYADSGELHLKFTVGEEQQVDERVDFSVTLARPNKLRLHCYNVIAVCDGDKLRATVADLDKQVLEVAAPETMTLEALYADEALRQGLTQQIAGSSPQLALLLTSDFLKSVTEGTKSARRLDSATIEDELCDRIQIDRPDGELLFWIGQNTRALRRIEFPTLELKKHLESQMGGPISGLQLWADLKGAKLDTKVEDVAFRFETPADAKLVAQFDLRPLMPAPPQPSKLLGEKVGDFEFKRLDGTPVTRESLAGKVAIVDFWATWCGPCLENLPHLQEVYEKYKDDDRVEFVAVSLDQTEVTPQTIEETFAKAGLEIPIARDLDQTAAKTFQVEGIPNLFILGPDGTIQDNELGMNPELAKELPARVDKLLAGTDIHPDALARYEKRKSQYEAELSAPAPADETTPQIKAQIASRSEPGTLTLTQLWNNTELKQPGNVWPATTPEGATELLVNEGWRGVARLDAQGGLVERKELPTPEMTVVSYLRVAQLPDGARRYVGSASAQKQMHLFDETFSKLLTHPAGTDAEVADVAFTDLDADQTPELAIGYWGTRGVELLELSGTSRWTAGDMENVYRVTPAVLTAGSAAKLLAAHGRGTLAVIDLNGKLEKEIAVDKRFLRAVYAADLDGDGASELCALSPVDEGRDVLVGFDSAGKELWSYDLPAGLHEQPIENVTWGPLVENRAQWVVAAADGSIHILDRDGRLVDRFHHGAQLTGLAVTRIDDAPALIVSSIDGVSAWRVGNKSTEAAGPTLD